jgi:large subunit ribosomal protein L30
MATQKSIKLTQIRSKIGGTRIQRECLRGLGLRGIGCTATVQDTPAVRGLIDKVAHLVQVGE